MSWILNRALGRRLRRETDRYLRELAEAPARASAERVNEVLRGLRAGSGAKVHLGETQSGQALGLPLEELLKAHGSITGGTGSGKTMSALLIVEALIASGSGFGVLDPKGDLAKGALFLLKRALDVGGLAAKALRKRIVILDFGTKDPVTPYNVLAKSPGADPDFFCGSRADLMIDLLPGPDGLSLPGSSVLHRLMALLSNSSLPLTMLTTLVHDEQFRENLLAKCTDRALVSYFRERYPETPKATLAAIERRMDALFAAESVRLALAGTSAPDWRRLQDDSRIVIVNCFGENLSRGVRRLLQALVLSDIRHAVFARREKQRPFLWLLDESQNFFLTETLREHMAELLQMSRSFGTHFIFMTQNISTAVRDPRTLRTLHTNTRWALALRGEPDDAAFLRPALPVTGRKLRPSLDPFAPASFYTAAEERSLALEAIASLPDRTGYFWLKARSPEAFLIRTRDIDIPAGDALDSVVASVRNDSTLGDRVSRNEYERLIAEREWAARPEPAKDADVTDVLAEAYRRTRGSSELKQDEPGPGNGPSDEPKPMKRHGTKPRRAGAGGS